MSYPKVAIIILNYNGLVDTIECLESLRKSTYPNYEVVVVDNGSEGSDADVLSEKFGSYIHIIRNDKNYGFPEGNNIGIRYALDKGTDYVLLLNNDTIVAPDFLDELIKVTRSDTRIGIVGPKNHHYDEPERLGCTGGKINYWTCSIKHIGARQIDNGQLERVENFHYITGTCMLISFEVLQSAGLLDSRFFFAGGEDADICIRASKLGFKIAVATASNIWHKGESRAIMHARGTHRRLIGYYALKRRFLLMEKHWSKAQFAAASFCLVTVHLPHWFFIFLRYYHSWDMLKAFLRGLWDYITRKELNSP